MSTGEKFIESTAKGLHRPYLLFPLIIIFGAIAVLIEAFVLIVNTFRSGRTELSTTSHEI